MREEFILPDTVRFDDEKMAVVIVDQSLLPGKVELLYLRTQEQIHRAIYLLKVRGAPAIGVTAAYGLYLAAEAITTKDPAAFLEQLRAAGNYLASSRPTAVNLFWALDRMMNVPNALPSDDIDVWKAALRKEAEAIHQEDIQMCQAIGRYGLTLLKDGDGILTHCNAGWLATSKYGTALAPLHLGKEAGMQFHVYADETRPLLQGARLSAYELSAHGIDTTVICDNMAATVMKEGKIQAVLVGADRIAANGDTANKIGTCGVAILAKYYRIPFYVLAPYSTIDMNCPDGAHIKIEQRPDMEIREKWYLTPMLPQEAKTYNPAFDVTEHDLISAIVTDKGILYPPFDRSISEMMEGK